LESLKKRHHLEKGNLMPTIDNTLEALSVIYSAQREELGKIEAITTLAIVAVQAHGDQVKIETLCGAMAAIRSSARSLRETITGETGAASL